LQGSHDLNIANESFENMAEFKYLEMRVTNQNYILEEIECTLNLGNVCSH
jgi:hypothetical protein